MTKKYKILLAEDEKDISELIQKIVAKDPKYELLLAYNGEEASTIIKQNKTIFGNNLSCIILDLGLPVMDGVSLINELNLKKKTASIPIILYSTYDYARVLNPISKYLTGIIFKDDAVTELLPMLDQICVEKDIEGVRSGLVSKLAQRGANAHAAFEPKKGSKKLPTVYDLFSDY